MFRSGTTYNGCSISYIYQHIKDPEVLKIPAEWCNGLAMAHLLNRGTGNHFPWSLPAVPSHENQRKTRLKGTSEIISVI